MGDLSGCMRMLIAISSCALAGGVLLYSGLLRGCGFGCSGVGGWFPPSVCLFIVGLGVVMCWFFLCRFFFLVFLWFMVFLLPFWCCVVYLLACFVLMCCVDVFVLAAVCLFSVSVCYGIVVFLPLPFSFSVRGPA